jgi:hypothetical protein
LLKLFCYRNQIIHVKKDFKDLEAVHLRGRLHRVHRQAEDLEEQRRLDRYRILRKYKDGNNNYYYYSQFTNGCL